MTSGSGLGISGFIGFSGLKNSVKFGNFLNFQQTFLKMYIKIEIQTDSYQQRKEFWEILF